MIIETIVVVAGMGVTYFVMDKYLGRSTSNEDKFDTTKGEYTLQELADNLWLKNERKEMGDGVNPAEYKRAIDDKPEFIHEATNSFWVNTVAHEYGWLFNDQRTGFGGLIEAVKIVLKYLDDPKYASLSSVSSAYAKIGNESKEWDNECATFKLDNTYSIYANFTILTHSLGVAEEILPIVRGNERNYMWAKKIGISILCALCHDLGKIKRQIDAEDKRSHEHISMDVCRELLDGVIAKEKIELIVNAISRHHMEINEANPHFLIPSLIKADHARRARELKLHKDGIQSEDAVAQTKEILEIKEEKIDEVARIVTFFQELIEELDPARHTAIFDKNKPQFLYVSKSELDEYAFENNISHDALKILLAEMRRQKIIGLVDFTKYDSYKLIVKDEEGNKHEYAVIPLDYSMIGVDMQSLIDKFSQYNTPTIVSNPQISGTKK